MGMLVWDSAGPVEVFNSIIINWAVFVRKPFTVIRDLCSVLGPRMDCPPCCNLSSQLKEAP